MNEALEIISNEVYVSLAPWIIMAIIAGAQVIGGVIKGGVQNKQAKEVKKEGDYYRKYGMQGMEALLESRQQQYNNMWNMIYGGVENFDFSKLSAQGVQFGTKERSGNRQGATDIGTRGGSLGPHSDQPPQGKDDLEKNRDWWTQHRLPHENEM